MRGRDIKKYNYEFADLYLINTHNGVKEKGISPIKTDDYPAIKKHLDLFKNQLEKRQDKGDTMYNLRNCAYIEDFSKQKIVWKRIGSLLRFSFDDNGCYSLDSTCFATGEKIKLLTAFFNSKVGNYILKDSPKTGTGDLLISVQAFDNVLIPKVSNLLEKRIDNLVDTLIICKDDKRMSEIELEIDEIFYKIYEFNKVEIELLN